MPKKKLNFNDYEFKFVDFNDREKGAYEKWVKKYAFTAVDALSSLMEERCKVSVSLDQNNGASAVYVTPKNDDLSVYGNIYVFRHNDLGKCILISLYYYTEILQRGEVDPDHTDALDW